MENIRIVLLRNIKARRKTLKITQEKLAERTGLSIGYIKNLEGGDNWPSPESLEALAKGLGVSIDELLSGPVKESVKLLSKDAVILMAEYASRVPEDAWKIGQELSPESWEAVAEFMRQISQRQKLKEAKEKRTS